MYAHYFGLSQEPFSIAPDPRFLFMSERHREALAHLLYGVGGGGGFVLLSGEIGAGKTTVCRCFLEQIPPRCNVAYIFNPKLTVIELLRSICDEFRIPTARIVPAHGAPAATVKDYLDPLNEFLLRTHSVGQNNVLIIDEAQNLSAEVLEQLRLLTNLETNDRKLLQIILIGQPELRDLLGRPELEQLAQRVIARFHLDALSDAETDDYIRHRLAVAGRQGPLPFDAGAMQRIHRLAHGVPRRINLICDRALLGAYATGRHVVDRSIVDRAALEVFGRIEASAAVPPARRRLTVVVGAALAGGLVLGASIVGVATWMAPDRHRVVRPSAAESAATVLAAARTADPAAPSASVSSASLSSTSASSPSRSSAPLSSAAVASPPGASTSRLLAGAAGRSPATAAAGPAPALTAADLGRDSALPARDERDAWRRLAPAWQLPPVADPCQSAEVQQARKVQCYRSTGSTLALIRQLDRPGVLTLRDGDGKPVYAVLTGLSDRNASVRIGDSARTVSLSSLATLWRGDFATFWRAPPNYAGGVVGAGSGPLAEWLTAQLARLQPAGDAVDARTAANGATASTPATEQALRARVSAFQLAQGLKPDGRAGPTTFMQLNRAIGVEEPHLQTDLPPPLQSSAPAPVPTAVPAPS